MDLVDAISRRQGTLRYDGRPVPQDVLLDVVAAGRHAVPLRPEIDTRWYIVWEGSVLAAQLERVGLADAYERSARLGVRLAHGQTAGHSRQAVASPPHYVIAVSKERAGFVENLGFCMEQLILAATLKGLGTCWIGALSDDADRSPSIEEHLAQWVPDLGEDERIVALTPLGYPARAATARLAERLVRWGSQNEPRRLGQSAIYREAWGVPWVPAARSSRGENAPPAGWTAAGRETALHQALQLALMAPSWADTPAWRMLIDGRWVIAVAPSPPPLDTSVPGDSFSRLDTGIAMCHFYLGAQALGLVPERRGELAPGTTDVLWRIPGAIERDRLGKRLGVPADYQVIGLFPLPRVLGSGRQNESHPPAE